MTTAPAPNLAWQEGMNTKAHVRTPRDHANTNIGSTSHGTEETHGDNTEMRHDVHHVGKARIPTDTHAQTIVKELAQISFTDGKNRGRTFEEVWNNDHDNSWQPVIQETGFIMKLAWSWWPDAARTGFLPVWGESAQARQKFMAFTHACTQMQKPARVHLDTPHSHVHI